MARAFVAARLPGAVLDAVAERLSRLSVPGRMTTRDQWHLTLQFLGNDVDLDAVASALAGLHAPRGRVRLGGAGAFPDGRRARVLWLGLSEGADLLARIADAVANRTAALGYEREDRRFRPHLTLARFRTDTDARPLIERIGNEPVGPAWELDTVSLYES